MSRVAVIAAVLVAAALVPEARQPSSSLPSTASEWNTPFEAFQLAGPIYYVGTADLATFLVATPQGHILIDGALPEGAVLIQQSIRTLGFKVEDVKILLTTQAHYDHVGSLAAMQKASGGQVMVMEGDADLVAAGGRGDYLFGDRYPFPAVKVDRVLKHGDTVSLGSITLRALHTPGHTKGSTTWQTAIVDDGRPLSVIFPASTSVNPGTVLPSMPTYPDVGADYERTFRTQAELRPDIWLGGHGSFFGLKDKRARQKAGEVNPFVDPVGWKASLDRRWAAHSALKPGPQP
jgi:metallo-beta-lactamase class B